MTCTEIILYILLIYGAWRGWRNGLLRELASMVGFLLGLVIAWNTYHDFGESLIMFFLLWIVVPLSLGMVASFITKLLDITIVLGIINRFFGAVVGVCKWGVLFIALSYFKESIEFFKHLL